MLRFRQCSFADLNSNILLAFVVVSHIHKQYES